MKTYGTPLNTHSDAPKPGLQISLRTAFGPGFQTGCASSALNAVANDYHRGTRF